MARSRLKKYGLAFMGLDFMGLNSMDGDVMGWTFDCVNDACNK
jgi:hypothetical protein